MNRKFISLIEYSPPNNLTKRLSQFRILQYNVLADGLFGLQSDIGSFSRVSPKIAHWDYRKELLLQEILQFDPDIITLQECDHYDDFFQPELLRRGYSGHFAPKPSSPCLIVSDKSDGCALFWKFDRIKIKSLRVRTN